MITLCGLRGGKSYENRKHSRFTPANLGKPHSDRVVRSVFAYGRRHEGLQPPFVIGSTAQLGYPESTIVGIGVTLLVCTVLYLIPRTAVLGAILLTGYLGGAVASNVRAGTPLFNMVFPMLFGVMAWASLVLRDKRLESILLKAE